MTDALKIHTEQVDFLGLSAEKLTVDETDFDIKKYSLPLGHPSREDFFDFSLPFADDVLTHATSDRDLLVTYDKKGGKKEFCTVYRIETGAEIPPHDDLLFRISLSKHLDILFDHDVRPHSPILEPGIAWNLDGGMHWKQDDGYECRWVYCHYDINNGPDEHYSKFANISVRFDVKAVLRNGKVVWAISPIHCPFSSTNLT